jgi:hypothetical protein
LEVDSVPREAAQDAKKEGVSGAGARTLFGGRIEILIFSSLLRHFRLSARGSVEFAAALRTVPLRFLFFPPVGCVNVRALTDI